MNVRAVAGLVPLLALSAGCGEDGGGDDGVKKDMGFIQSDGGSSDAGADDGGAGGGGGEPRLRLSYIKEVRPQGGGAGRVDLYLYDFTENEQFNLTSGDAADVVDCATKQCKLTADQEWVAWLTSEAGGGFSLWVAPVDVDRKLVEVDKKRKVNDQVNAFDYSGAHLVYTRGQATAGGTIDVLVEPIAGPTGECDADPAVNQGQPTCQQLIGQIDGNGGFRVTPFGSLIILLRTTLASMTVDFYNIESGANQSLYTFGSQDGTGSQYDGKLPVALSPDATYLAVATRQDLIWRLHTLEARPNPPAPQSLDLFELRSNPAGDCTRALPHDTDGEVFFNQFLFNPRFSHDGDYVYFLAKGDCSKRDAQAPVNRDDHDIFRIGRDLQGPKNMTNNPRASHWSNHDIGDFDLTADADMLAFTAQRPNDSTSRSIWLMRFDGDNASFDCSRVMGAPPQGIDGKPHCEFIFDSIAGSSVVHRNVTFHVVNAR